MFNKVEFKKIRDFGEIINDTFTFIRQNFKPLLKVFIYLCGFFVLATVVSNVLQQFDILYNIRSASDGIFRSSGRVFTIQYFFSIIFTFASYNAVTVSVLSYIAIYVEKGKVVPTVEQVWAYFKYYFFRTWGSSIAISLFMIVCAIPCGIPLIYVFPALSLLLPVMVFENASFSYSFSRCFKLIKDNWGLTAGAIFIIWIITYSTVLIGSIPTIIITMAGTFIHSSKALGLLTVTLGVLIQSLFQVFLIVPTVCVALCYYNLVERHENSGLFDRINDLGEKKTDFNSNEEY